VLLRIYLTTLGCSDAQIGAVATATLLGPATLTPGRFTSYVLRFTLHSHSPSSL
jgi:hypothetical protein